MTAPSPNVASVRLVVLNFNGGGFVQRCLEHLRNLDHPRDRLEIVVIDNASTDGSADAIDADFPDVTLVRRPHNEGFGANNHAFVDLDDVDYVALVNPDAFVEPGWLGPLVDALDADATLGAACPKILLDSPDVIKTDVINPDVINPDVINNAGSILIEGGWGADRGLGEPDVGQYDEECDVFAWCGGGVLLRPAYLADVGGFDETFFLYYEDTDLSWRGQARGWRYRYIPSARMRHLHSASTVVGSATFAHFVERNRLIMLAKNAPAGFALRAFLRFPLSTAGIIRTDVVMALLRGSRPDLGTVRRRVRAFFAALGRLPHAVGQRRQLRRRQSVDDATILAWQVPKP